MQTRQGVGVGSSVGAGWSGKTAAVRVGVLAKLSTEGRELRGVPGSAGIGAELQREGGAIMGEAHVPSGSGATRELPTPNPPRENHQ